MHQRNLLVGSVATLGLLIATSCWAQPGGRGGRGGPGAFGIGGLLMSEQVRAEIDLLDEQEQEVREIGEEARDRMRELFSGVRGLPPEERRAAMQEARADMRELRSEVEDRIKDVLMPQQFDRLRQIELQQQLRRRGGGALTNDRVAETLGLSSEQREQMQSKAAEVQQRLDEQIKKLRNEAREEILTVLTPEQRAMFDEMIGKPFELERGDRRRGRRGGDRARRSGAE